MDSQRTDNLDGTVAWLVCICAMFSSSIGVGSVYIYGIFFPFLLEEFEESKSKTALVGSLSMGFYTFLSPLSSKICLRFGCRAALIVGGIIGSLGFLVSSFASDLYLLYLGYGFMLGSTASLAYVSSFQMISLYFDKHRFSATGLMSVGPLVGLISLSPIAQTLSDNNGWRRSMMIIGGIHVVSCLLGCTITRRTNTINGQTNNDQSYSRPNNKRNCLHVLDFSLLKNPKFMIISISTSITQLGNHSPYFHLATHAAEIGILGYQSAWMYFAIGAASIVSRILTGKFLDAFQILPLRLGQLSLVVFAIADFLVPSIRRFSLLLVYSFVNGICDGVFGSTISCIVTEQYSGMGFGWFLSFQGVSLLISPILTGFIADVSGSYHPAFYTAGGILLFSACLFECSRWMKDNIKENLQLTEEGELVIVEMETVC